jgi:hypothetical protein
MKKKSKIFIFCMIFVVKITPAQQIPLQPNTVKGLQPGSFPRIVLINEQRVEKSMVSPRFYVNNLGFFCKQELKFRAATGLPMVFRLGSLQYCDRMEGKKNAGILPAY